MLYMCQGLLWVNGFPMGWYWPTKGPQNTMYIPGPLLQPGSNEFILLESELDLGSSLTGRLLPLQAGIWVLDLRLQR